MGRQDLSRTLCYDLISNVRGVDFLYKFRVTLQDHTRSDA